MSLSIAARMLAARCPPPARRRPMYDDVSCSLKDKISKLSEPERDQLLKCLDEMDVELQGKLEKHVDAYLQRSTFSNDKGYINRVLTFFRVPKGESREKLLWYTTLAGTFVVSAVRGHNEANRLHHNCFKAEQGEDTAADSM